MHPVLLDGMHVSVRPSNLYIPGDIIVFEADFGEILSHRLIGLYRRKGKVYFLTQADNASNADRRIEKDRILGKVQIGIPLTTRLLSGGRFIRFTGKWILHRAIR
jgi:SOS-response transcriptional repressor LexA